MTIIQKIEKTHHEIRRVETYRRRLDERLRHLYARAMAAIKK